MVQATQAPGRADLVRQAADLVPRLQENAGKAEENRRLPDETIEALAGAGVFKLRTPKKYGGYEVDTTTLLEVATQLARGDGSVAWTTSVYWIPTWMAGLFPDAVQDEVFSTPDVRVCGTLSPGGEAVPVDGGYSVTGKWGFVSGAWHAHWQQIIAVGPGPEGQPMPVVALVPITDLQMIDDWDTAGMRGSGSISTVAKDLFVPAERVLPLPAILAGRAAAPEFGIEQGAPGIHGAPLLPVAAASSVGQTVGLARAALDIFTERMHGRKITYTDYEQQTDAPVTHLQLAEATLAADEADFHARRLTGAVDTRSQTGEAWSPLERAQARADLGAAVGRSKTAIDTLATASGGSSIYSGVPIQRVWRDIQAINLHALMHAQTNTELYGRVLCGLPPNTLYF